MANARIVGVFLRFASSLTNTKIEENSGIDITHLSSKLVYCKNS